MSDSSTHNKDSFIPPEMNKHLMKQCNHGVFVCQSCEKDHQEDKVIIGVLAALGGLIFGAALGAVSAEPDVITITRTLYVPIGDGQS